MSCDTGDAFKTKFCLLKKKNCPRLWPTFFYELIKRPTLPLSGPPDRKERRRRSEIEARCKTKEAGTRRSGRWGEGGGEAVTRRERTRWGEEEKRRDWPGWRSGGLAEERGGRRVKEKLLDSNTEVLDVHIRHVLLPRKTSDAWYQWSQRCPTTNLQFWY